MSINFTSICVGTLIRIVFLKYQVFPKKTISVGTLIRIVILKYQVVPKKSLRSPNNPSRHLITLHEMFGLSRKNLAR